jgi:hypothetical protein
LVETVEKSGLCGRVKEGGELFNLRDEPNGDLNFGFVLKLSNYPRHPAWVPVDETVDERKGYHFGSPKC